MATGRVKMLLWLLLAVLAHTGNGLQNVSLRVSSLKSTLKGHELDTFQHELLMDWQPGLDADWIGLFNVTSLQQVTQDTQPLVRISPDDYPDGYYSINISFAELQYPNGWSKGSGEKPIPGDACLSYWIAAYKHNELLEADCLKIYPTWMWDHRSELENMPLIGLFFPGTYSGLNYNMGSTPLPRQTVSHFLLTQDSDVWGELIRGVRYLDVDLRYCPNQEKSSSTSETPKDGRQRRGTPTDGPAAAAGSDDGIQWTVSCIDGAQSVAKISGVPGLGGYLGGGYGGGGRRSAATGGGALVRSPAGRGSADTPAAAALPRAWRSVSGGDDTRHRCSVSDKKNDLLFVLKDVKEFLKTAKYEIVILDFHHFPEGFEGQTNLHHEFVSLLYSELGDYILPFNNITYNSTLKEVWHAGHNIIVAYNDSETTKGSSKFWKFLHFPSSTISW